MHIEKKIRYFFLSLLTVKVIYLIFSVSIIAGMTTLGDSMDYLSGKYQDRENLLSPAKILSITGYILSEKFGMILSQIPALILATLGVTLPIFYSGIRNNFLLVILFFIAIFPSNGIWTSMHSKEAIIVFSFGASICYLINFLEKGMIIPRVLPIIGFLGLLIFKPLLFATFVLVSVLIILKFKLKPGFEQIILITLSVLICFVFYVYFSSEILSFMLELEAHFDDGGSSRENTFWNDEMDVLFWLIPGGVMSFMGPTVVEAVSSPFMLVVFIESIFIVFLLLTLICYLSFRLNKDISIFVLMLLVALVLLAYHYPYGMFNAGSAIRYRSGFLSHLFFLIVYIGWHGLHKKRRVIGIKKM